MGGRRLAGDPRHHRDRPASDITEQLSHYGAQGITEVIYQPTGPDIPGELEAFITAARPALSSAQTNS